MSQLKLYQPSGETQTLRFDSPQLDILSFHAVTRRSKGRGMSVLMRAKLLHDNRVCPHCSHPVVEPLELEDALVNGSQMPIPGTATLVGFHCHGCEQEWPV